MMEYSNENQFPGGIRGEHLYFRGKASGGFKGFDYSSV